MTGLLLLLAAWAIKALWVPLSFIFLYLVALSMVERL